MRKPWQNRNSVIEAELMAWLKSRVSPRRFQHSLGVREAVTGLARHYKVDPKPLRLAALLHDAARELPPERLLSLAAEWRLEIRGVDLKAPVLLHGRIAAANASREFGLTDSAVLSAIRSHTAGHPQMSLSDKLFFLADHIEPGRGHPHVKELRKLVYQDIDEAMLYAIEINERFLKSAGALIDPDTSELKRLLLGFRRSGDR